MHTPPHFISLSLLLLLGLARGLPAASQPAAARVYRDRVEARWFADNTRFWYRNELPGDGREFILVDIPRRLRIPAFDHRTVAELLSKDLGRTVTASNLPIDSLEFADDLSTVLMRGGDGAWRLRFASYELARDAASESTEGLPKESEPRPSTRTGPESAIFFENRLNEAVDLFWINPEGNRVPYGQLKPGESRRQHTFAGHVWAALRDGNVVAVFEAAPTPQRARIDDRPADRRRGRRGARPTNPESVPTAVRSPDGRHEAFVRDHNLWVRNVGDGGEFALSFDGNPGDSFRKDVQRARLVGMEFEAPEPPATLPDVHWSPDSRRIVALQTRAVPERRVSLVESSPRDQLQPRSASYPYLKPGDDLPVGIPRLFHLETRREIPVPRDRFPNPWELERFRWAPDGSHFTFLYNRRGHQVMRVLAVDAASGAVSVLVDEECATFFDYSQKTYLEFLDSTGDLVWMSERGGWNHLYRFDARTGALRNPITRGDWVVRQVDRVDAERGHVWFRAGGIRPGQDPYHLHLARVNLDGSGLVVLTEGDGTHEIQWSPDRKHFVDTWSRVDLPPVTELRRAEDGALVCPLETADASEVLAARGRFPERFVAKGRDGTTDIWGILHRPRDFDPTRRYPIIENIYAGPHGHHVPKAFRPHYRTQSDLADRGFVVVQIDGMGTNWRSKRFHDMAWRNIADAGFPDRIAWIKAAAAALPGLDPARVGIYGGSAGGQNALRAVIAHGDFYSAAAADCGCHDNRMDKIWWNEAWMGWPVGPHYAEQSNVSQAHRLQGKLLLTVGELDRNVDPASTLQVVDALIKADKEFEFVLFPGQGHGAGESDYGRRRRSDFFVRHLHSR